ncbi:MAG: alkene reductase [Planctomycetaceae bacterium]
MTVGLFSPLRVGAVTAPSRIFMAPMTRARTDGSGVPSPLAATYYSQRASAGLIITEATHISPQAVGYSSAPGMFASAQADGWRNVVEQVHQAGGRIFVQLVHCGRISHPLFQPNQMLPVAPSAIAAKGTSRTPAGVLPLPVPRALERDEIPSLVQQFVNASALARQIGFDGVELQAGNGFLIDQFLRDGTNQRTDDYGGSVENRSRFLLDVVQGVASKIGADRTAVRLSPSSAFNDMRDSQPRVTFAQVVAKLNPLGLAYLHLNEAQEGDIRQGVDPIPVGFFRSSYLGVLVANGGFTKERASQAIQNGEADAVSFGVPFLANPDLPKRFSLGLALNAPDPNTFYGGDEKGYIDYPSIA